MTPAELDAIEARATYDARIAVHAKDQHYASRVADRLALIAEVRRLQGAMYVVERRGIVHGSIVGIFPTYQEAYNAGLERAMDFDVLRPYRQSDGDGWHNFTINKWRFGQVGGDPVGKFVVQKNRKDTMQLPWVYFVDAHGDRKEVKRT